MHLQTVTNSKANTLTTLISLVTIALGAEYIQAQETNPFVFRDVPTTVEFYGPDPNANAVREYTFGMARSFVNGRGRSFVVTSANRTASSSAAHADGAIDFRSNDINGLNRHAEAKGLSKQLGPDFTVIVEEGFLPGRDNDGAQPVVVATAFRTLTAYRDGKAVSLSFSEHKPTHTHIQRRKGTTAAALVAKLGLAPTTGGPNFLTYNRLMRSNFGFNLDLSEFNIMPIPGPTSGQLALAFWRAAFSGQGSPSTQFGGGNGPGTGPNFSGATPWSQPSANPPVMGSPNLSNMPIRINPPPLNLPPLTISPGTLP